MRIDYARTFSRSVGIEIGRRAAHDGLCLEFFSGCILRKITLIAVKSAVVATIVSSALTSVIGSCTVPLRSVAAKGILLTAKAAARLCTALRGLTVACLRCRRKCIRSCNQRIGDPVLLRTVRVPRVRLTCRGLLFDLGHGGSFLALGGLCDGLGLLGSVVLRTALLCLFRGLCFFCYSIGLFGFLDLCGLLRLLFRFFSFFCLFGLFSLFVFFSLFLGLGRISLFGNRCLGCGSCLGYGCFLLLFLDLLHFRGNIGDTVQIVSDVGDLMGARQRFEQNIKFVRLQRLLGSLCLDSVLRKDLYQIFAFQPKILCKLVKFELLIDSSHISSYFPSSAV